MGVVSLVMMVSLKVKRLFHPQYHRSECQSDIQCDIIEKRYQMKVLAIEIKGFRGIRNANIVFGQHSVLVGANGAGKSTILDALSLVFGRTQMVRDLTVVFGRTQMVRDLTEHDFFGSTPAEATRFRIVVTLGGFSSDNPEDHSNWFRDGRGVPKWWNEQTYKVEPQASNGATDLCVQIGLAARF